MEAQFARRRGRAEKLKGEIHCSKSDKLNFNTVINERFKVIDRKMERSSGRSEREANKRRTKEGEAADGAGGNMPVMYRILHKR